MLFKCYHNAIVRTQRYNLLGKLNKTDIQLHLNWCAGTIVICIILVLARLFWLEQVCIRLVICNVYTTQSNSVYYQINDIYWNISVWENDIYSFKKSKTLNAFSVRTGKREIKWIAHVQRCLFRAVTKQLYIQFTIEGKVSPDFN